MPPTLDRAWPEDSASSDGELTGGADREMKQCRHLVTDRAVRPDRVVEHGDGTPTGLARQKNARSCIIGIPGGGALCTYTKPSRRKPAGCCAAALPEAMR